MTRLQSAISYFSKENKNPKGTLQKINAYEAAEKSLRDTEKIYQIFSNLLQDMVTPDNACKEIAAILKTH